MATIKFPRKEFEKTIKLTEEIKNQINLFGVHLESLTDKEIELEILPNRPDLFSFQGFLRSFSAFLGKRKEKGIKKYKLNKPEKNFEVKISKTVKNIRPYTACAIIKNIKFNDEKIKEVIDIQEKIHNTLGRNRKKIAIGIYPLEKIKLPIKLEARNPKEIKFIPLEMNREMNGLQILQQHPTGREYAHLLEGFDKFPVFVDAAGEILSMPPIINSHKTGKITENTKDIFIECSGFDFEILKKTLNILVTMFADFGGEIYQMNLIYESENKNILSPNLNPEKIKINLNNVNNLLGIIFKESEIKNLLQKMEYNYLGKGIVEIPGWRADIMHEVDLIEDIAIAYGYDNFKPEIPSIATTGEIEPLQTFKKKISDIISGLGLLELSTYHLLTQEDKDKLNINEAIEVEKSKSEYKILRPNLISSILKVLGSNVDNEYPQKVFEIGRIFNMSSDKKEETRIKEEERLCIMIADKDSNFTTIKQILDYLVKMLAKEYKIENNTNAYFIEGRCGKIIINNKEIGVIGEIHPVLLSGLKIKMPVSCLELSIKELLK